MKLLVLASISLASASIVSLNETRVQLVGSYDWTFGEISLWHSESTYCDPSSYLSRTYKGVLSGFVPVYHITEESHGS